MARADADGYTLLFAPALVLSVLPQARGADVGYKSDALVPVCQTFINTMGLVVRPDSPISTMVDLVTAAKQKPGALNYGHPGVLTIPQLAMEEFLQTADDRHQGHPVSRRAAIDHRTARRPHRPGVACDGHRGRPERHE